MAAFYLTMITCGILAKVVDNGTKEYSSVLIGAKKKPIINLIYMMIPILLIWFGGLRQGYNDTWTYKENFEVFVTVGPVNWAHASIMNYGGFDIYQQIIKTYINENSISLVFVTCIITTILYMHFIKKYSVDFTCSIILFLIGPYMFSIAGIKQALSTVFAFYVIDAYYRKKYVLAILILLLAFSFHPYVICLMIFPLIDRQVWDKRVIFIGLAAILIMANLETVLGVVADVGKSYSTDDFADTPINPFRVAIEAIPILLSFINRKKINDEFKDNKIAIIGLNMAIIAFIFICLGMFFRPMYMGRIALYYSALQMFGFPPMINAIYKDNPNKKLLKLGFYLFWIVYFVLDFTKLGKYGLFKEQFFRMPMSQFIDVMFHK